jgi:hypothetical protein
MRRGFILLGAGLAALGLFLTAMAAVTFDPDCQQTPSSSMGACGFVGVGDIQTAFGWNNPQFQQRAAAVTFTYSEEVEQTAVCENEHGAAELERHGTRTGTIGSEVVRSLRNNRPGDITGILLTAVGDVEEDFTDWVNETQPGNDDIIPACFNNSEGWELTYFNEESSGAALYAHWGTTTVQIYP